MSKILIIEDEESIADLEKDYLELSDFAVTIENDGEKGLQRALSEDYDLYILDLMLPGVDGFEICKKIRETKNTPIIMVSAKKDDIDKIRGLGLGADDYMTKPFSVKELIARIRANTRRRQGTVKSGGGQQGFGPFTVDLEMQEVRKDGQPVELTQREYDLVCYFLNSSGRVVSREELMEKVWGYDYYGDLRAVDVAMRRLREKLEEDPANPQYFVTKRGAGYFLQK